MDVLTLVRKDKPDTDQGYGCGQCRRYWGIDRASAEECCSPTYCEDCKAPVEHKHYTLCNSCQTRRQCEKADAEEAALFERAKKIGPGEAPCDMVYWEGGLGDCNGDHYYTTLESLLEDCENEGYEIPEYVWSCEEQELSMDANSIIESALEEWYDEASSEIPQSAVDELQALLNTWCEARKMRCYNPNYKVAIVIPEEWRNEKENEESS